MECVDQGREADEAEVGGICFVVAGCHAAIVFDAVDEAFHVVSQLITSSIMTTATRSLSRRNDRCPARPANLLTERIAVVSLVGHHVSRRKPGQQRLGLSHVMFLSTRQLQSDQLPLGCDGGMNLGAQSTPRAANRLFVLPPFAPAPC